MEISPNHGFMTLFTLQSNGIDFNSEMVDTIIYLLCQLALCFSWTSIVTGFSTLSLQKKSKIVSVTIIKSLFLKIKNKACALYILCFNILQTPTYLYWRFSLDFLFYHLKSIFVVCTHNLLAIRPSKMTCVSSNVPITVGILAASLWNISFLYLCSNRIIV